jgi:hypothetical protein
MFGGDDRYYQNIFIGDRTPDVVGTSVFDGFTTSLEEYIQEVDAHQPCDHSEFFRIKQPVYVAGNVYLNNAKAFDKEEDKLDKPEFDAGFAIVEENGKIYINVTMPDDFESFVSAPHDTHTLGRVRIVDADFEDFDGGVVKLNRDYFDVESAEKSVVGPFAGMKNGVNKICVT